LLPAGIDLAWPDCNWWFEKRNSFSILGETSMKAASLRPALAVAFAGMLLVSDLSAPAHAADGPPAGLYNIRLYAPTRVGDNAARINYSITSYMILRADGNYEVYEKATKALRSRGTYTYEPGKEGLAGSERRVRWKSGLNYEMGRGGSYFPKCMDGPHCLIIGVNAVALLKQ
jgi:hypothetical protein